MTVHLQASHKQERKTMADRSLLPVDYLFIAATKDGKIRAFNKKQVNFYGKQNFPMRDLPHPQSMK